MIGFYGKLPKHGDFVSRGLDSNVKRPLDVLLAQLVTAELPEDGLRASLKFADQMWLALILPSFDTTGRYFPFAALSPFVDASFEAAEARCANWIPPISKAIKGSIDAEALPLEAVVKKSRQVPEAVWTSSTPPTPLAQALEDLSSG